MILVREVKTEEVDKDRIRIAHYEAKTLAHHSFPEDPNKDAYLEVIQGRRFINMNGDEVCIGLSKQVEESLGIYFGAYENLMQHRDTLIQEANQIGSKLIALESKIKKATFRQRFKYLFTGKL